MLKQKQIWGDGFVSVPISAKWMRHRFPCTPKYITRHCHGRCCQGSGKLLISLLPEEEKTHALHGRKVERGLLQTDKAVCPHKTSPGLCSLHGTPEKPFGCIASPFTINKNGTLIIRHRYSLLKCHGNGRPAYKTFRASLSLLFGEPEAERICTELDAGAQSVTGAMPASNHGKLVYLDGLKKIPESP